MGVSVLSLSLASFDDCDNNSIQHTAAEVCIKDVCAIAKEYDFTLRLSLNMNYHLWESAQFSVENIFKTAKNLGADQLTFRKLYAEGDNSQSEWIKKNAVDESVFDEINDYIIKKGRLIGVLPYGYQQYSVNGISVVVDKDCMNEGRAQKETSKYFVLRPDCKLYDGWQKEDIIF